MARIGIHCEGARDSFRPTFSTRPVQVSSPSQIRYARATADATDREGKAGRVVRPSFKNRSGTHSTLQKGIQSDEEIDPGDSIRVEENSMRNNIAHWLKQLD